MFDGLSRTATAEEPGMTHGSLSSLVTGAASSLLNDYDDFWILSAVTERGFEEGVRNRNFAESVRSFADAGVPDDACTDLSLGMNGMLARLIGRLRSDVTVTSQPSRGRD